jgi:DNA-binding PadR family transcriptional regulator
MIMGCTYAPASPWLKFDQVCGPGSRDVLAELFAMMTGHSGHRSRRGFGPWAMWGGPPWGPGWAGGGRGPKARRGDVRAAILAVLAEQPRNGYQVIQEIVERSGGVWKPSPGSIYPTLQQLEDEGLARTVDDGGRRAYTLTPEGQAYVDEHLDEIAAPWEAMGETSEDDDGLKPLIGQVAAAIWQIAAVGTPEQQAKGREALRDLRRRLHAILAEDEPRTDRR